MVQQGIEKKSVITVEISSTEQLYSCYMPFLEGGGLFIPTEIEYKMGESILVRLKFLKENSVLPISGKVAWIAPANVQGRQRQGIGIRFTNQDDNIKQKIEDALMGRKAKSNNSTFTL